MSVEYPWLLTALVLLPFAWWLGRRTQVSLTRRHHRVVTVLRLLALACLVAALVAPAWRGVSTKISVVYALDVSHSVAPQFIDAALGWIEDANRRGQPGRSRVLAFAERPRLAAGVDEVRALQLSESDDSAGAIKQSATNLERALDLALLGFDAASIKRLVLMSDGNATEGDVWRVVPRLRAAGVRVFTVPATVRAGPVAWVESVEPPAQMRRNEPVTVKLAIGAAHETGAKVMLRDGSRVLASRQVKLKTGINPVAMETRIDRVGSATLAASVVVDKRTAPQELRRAVWLEPVPKLLYVEGHPASATYLREALTAQGIEVSVQNATELPDSVARYAGYDALLLSDVSADQVSAAQMQALESWVRDGGGGFLFAAGESTYGEKSPQDKGYAGSLVEKILPLQFKAQEKKKELAMVIAIDRSYSMKGRKMNFAKEAARATLDLLEEQHRLAVIAFDSQPYISVPMQPLKAKRKVEDLISRIQASGQTSIYPALQIAFRMLNEQDVKSKHVILLSDGDTNPADFQRLVTRMADAKITVSTVTLAGDGADEQLMADIAKWGRGRTYTVEDVETLPQIFIDETQKAVRSNLVEGAFRPVVKRKVQALKDLDFAKAPELKGYVSTKVRDTAELLLVSDSGAPILARWQYGLGRTVGFASDVKNRWSADWLGWDGYAKLWAQLVRETMQRDSGEQLSFDVAREGSTAVVTLSALTADGRFVTTHRPRVRLSRAAGAARTVELQQYAPGVYQARVAVQSSAEPIQFELLESAGLPRAVIAKVGPRALYYTVPDEDRFRPPNIELLKALARETSGGYAPDAAEIFAGRGDSGESRTELWPWLAALALLLYLAEIFLRRAPIAWRRFGD